MDRPPDPEVHDVRTVLRDAITGQRRHVALSTLFVTGHQAGEAMVPFIIGVVIDRAVAGSAADLVTWLAVLAVVYIGLSFSYRFGERSSERAATQAAHGVRIRITERVLDHRGGAEAGRLPGALVSIATSDASRVGVVNIALPYSIAAVAAVLIAGGLLLSISLPLGLLVLLGTPPMLVLAHLLSKPLERRSETEQDRAAHASGIAADLLTGVRVLKGLGAAGAAVGRYRRTSREALGATVRAARAEAAYDGMALALNGIFLAVIVLVGGRLAADGQITVGQLISAAGLAQFLIGPLSTFGWVFADMAQARASAARITEVLTAAPAVTGGETTLPDPVRGQVTLHGRTVAPGELIGIVADPAEASALVARLGREAEPDGLLALDGVSLADVAPGDLRGALLVATHDADLFEESVRANISADADLGVVLGATTADEVVRSLPDGLDTVLDERGRSLSGGQRQRVALARALAADPPVLVLHDPTTAVDAVTEARIADGIRRLRQGRTTILITTSPALLAVTDRVIVLRDGAVAADRRHADLIGDDELYRSAVLA
ncbi:putative ABC transport system ATP-binding protein [Allocatelliglobosispora scoriae]|uniref:Putative ABC transport system ATP-binding protein n=1 Tax=Allocatelliglobosispora scoriae TaxID=643052 RepID=A0A841BNB6_9ACTN|nr:ABC transporter ATP-binding protein [Allocatelliglobosispora scoriae]MBB5868321.1 putative ABC transport system ATP-binding protein [Allocatelliglobosispora scoriae]